MSKFNMSTVKSIIINNKILSVLVLSVKKVIDDKKVEKSTRKVLDNVDRSAKKIFYIGIPVHRNLGDLAQGVCIRRWLKKNYPEYLIVEIETDALVNTRHSFLPRLKALYAKGDFIVFQSGYTTTDLGGYADEMHRAVMQVLPEARMLMLPQTIFFEKEENKKRTAECYNAMKRMLFLARDRVSYGMACEMFPDIPVKLYPDIVTTLIGNKQYNEAIREGIMFCCRNDKEKYYSDNELSQLMSKCKSFATVDQTDTTKAGKRSDVVRYAERVIDAEIECYSKYRVVITDRYHGTIFALIAGTPVIIIKTKDHKVTTGAEWFKGIYDEYVYLADDLEDAYQLANKIYEKQLTHKLEPYFEREYYDKLPALFEECSR